MLKNKQLFIIGVVLCAVILVGFKKILRNQIFKGTVEFIAGEKIDFYDNAMTPKTDGEDDLGASGTRFKTGYFDVVLGNKGANLASAATLTLGTDGNVFSVTGTAQIDSIVAKPAGFIVYLISASTDTVLDGKNLKLAGQFNGTADDVLTLISNGTNWYELGRSAN